MSTYILSVESRKKILETLSNLDLTKTWQLDLKPYVPKRSDEANKRLWKLHDMASGVTGYTKTQLQELTLGEFFGWEVMEIGGKKHRYPRQRSHDKNKKEFNEYMQFVEQFYAEKLGVWLP